MNSIRAKQLAERVAASALRSAEGDWHYAHTLMVKWAEQDPLLREAIRIYVETEIPAFDKDCS
jgi:hypothetical protein